MSVLVERASRAAVAQVFEDIKSVLDATAGHFARKFQRDVEETKAEAYMHFLEIYHNFDPSLGRLEQRVVFILRRRLLDTLRKENQGRRGPRLKRNHVEDMDTLPNNSRPSIDRNEITAELSKDARLVVLLVLDTPDDLLEDIQGSKTPGNDSVRRTLWRYCRQTLRWSTPRVRRAFEEMSDVVQTY